MWDFCQFGKHVLFNILETNHQINDKPTEPFIHTIIKLSVEKKYMSWPEFFNSRPSVIISGNQ